MDEAQSKILRGSEGLVTPQMIEQRAQEIARADGRAEANDLDRSRAREDLIKGLEQSSTVGEPERDWYTPRGSSGEKAPKVRPEDEQNVPDKLIREGIDEADSDTRGRKK